ncbi:hypothetical protein LC147_11815 [Vibrio harveyi]|uniref:hypothetical protein n=1 Tax=Vibrio harveyi TaxID=669 RepID=UPI003BB64E9E
MFLMKSEDLEGMDGRAAVHSYIVSFSFALGGKQVMGSGEIHLNRPLRAFDHDLLCKHIFENNGSAIPSSHKDIVIMSVSPIGVTSCGVIKVFFERQKRQ